MNEWQSTEHALAYLSRADAIPHRTAGEAVLLEELPESVERVLDLGAGDGRLMALVLTKFPGAQGVALDFSPAMLERLNARFSGDARVQVVDGDLDRALPELGSFDAIVSSFAIHHTSHERKQMLYGEVVERLRPGGSFCNLEHVASASEMAHRRFLAELGMTAEDEDPSNQLLDVETQLRWLRELDLEDVDCYWKWRELALLVGRKSRTSAHEARSPKSARRPAVRAFEQRDRTQVVDLWREVFPGEPERNAPLPVIDRKLAVQHDLFLVAIDQESVAGTVIAGYDGYRGWVYHLAVRPAKRRQGIGRRLMHEAERRLSALGCPKVNLQVRADNAGVAAFYEALGYASEQRLSMGKIIETMGAE